MAPMTDSQLKTIVNQAETTAKNLEKRTKRLEKRTNPSSQPLIRVLKTLIEATKIIKRLGAECLKANEELKQWSNISSQIIARQTEVQKMRRKVSKRG